MICLRAPASVWDACHHSCFMSDDWLVQFSLTNVHKGDIKHHLFYFSYNNHIIPITDARCSMTDLLFHWMVQIDLLRFDWMSERFDYLSISITMITLFSESPSKKHKKHKKHKHKKRRSDGEVEGDISLDILGDIGDDEVDVVSTGHLPVEQPSGQPAIKLKIKIGGQSITQVTGSISSSVQIKEELWGWYVYIWITDSSAIGNLYIHLYICLGLWIFFICRYVN